MDQVRNNLSQVRTHLIERCVHNQFTGLEQPSHLGRRERASGVWKEIWCRVCFDQQLLTEGDVVVGAAETNRTRSTMMRRGGFVPTQWVLGLDVRIPGKLINPLDASRLETHGAISTSGSATSKQVATRRRVEGLHRCGQRGPDAGAGQGRCEDRGCQKVWCTSTASSDQ
jgi:hypothetical protein